MTDLKTITSNDAIKSFGKILRQQSQKKIGDPKDIIDAIRHAKSITPNAYDDKSIAVFLKSRSKTLADLSEQYLTAKLTALYGLVDPALFNLKRHVVVRDGKIEKDARRKFQGKRQAREVRFEFPLFVYAACDDEVIELGKDTTSTGDEWNRRRIMHELTVDVPEMPDDVKIEIPKSTGAYYRILGDLLMDEDLADINAKTEFYEVEHAITWIPKTSGLNLEVTEEIIKKEPVDYDPALLMVIGSNHFLVRTWDIKEEEPYDHFLREFTEGAYPKRK